MTYICFMSVLHLIKAIDFTVRPFNKNMKFLIQNSWNVHRFQSNFALSCSQKYDTDQLVVWKIFDSNLCMVLPCFNALNVTYWLCMFHFRLIFENVHTCFGEERCISTDNWGGAPLKRNTIEYTWLWMFRKRIEKLK